MRRALLSIILALLSLPTFAQTSLTVGDIAFVGYISDNTPGDEFYFMLLKDVDASTTITFTDNGWQSSNSFRSGEQTLTWTSGTSLTVGTIVQINGSGASIGGYSGAFLSLSNGGDQIFAYQGPGNLGDLIAGINWEGGSWGSNSTSSSTTALPSSLSNGTNAVTMIVERDNGVYNCTLSSGTPAALRTAINNASNWTIDDDPNSIITPPCVVSSAPEINVKQSTIDISSGGTHPFGSVQIGDSKEVVFTVENTGDAALDIVSITPTGIGYSISSAISADPVPASGSATFTVRFQPSATSQTSGSVTIASDDSDESSYVINFTSSVTDATLSLKVFLEGALSGSIMSTTINDALPVDPATVYSGVVAESSTGIPGTAVDWVEVELRSSTAATSKIGTNRAALIHSDGTITDKDGNPFTMAQVDGSSYHVVIHHRNHLSVMSVSAVSPTSGTYSFDFTTSQANNFSIGPDGAVQVGSVFAMIAGDADGDNSVDEDDLSTWRAQNGAAFSYGSNGEEDLNLDGAINAVDRNDFQQPNSGKSSQVPN
ncbi:MAG: choice-of-anchor D domain-containing protein [Cyclobacteriaceae bacterium]